MKMFARAFLAALLASVATVVVAQVSLTASVAVNWTAPVNDANGIPLAGGPNAVTGYNVYLSTTPLTATPATPTASVAATATTVSGTISAHVGDTVYAYVAACDATGCSVLSTPGTKLVVQPGAAPGVPTTVTVTITITAP